MFIVAIVLSCLCLLLPIKQWREIDGDGDKKGGKNNVRTRHGERDCVMLKIQNQRERNRHVFSQ